MANGVNDKKRDTPSQQNKPTGSTEDSARHVVPSIEFSPINEEASYRNVCGTAAQTAHMALVGYRSRY